MLCIFFANILQDAHKTIAMIRCLRLYSEPINPNID